MTQIGTVKLQTQNSGVVDVPVFETGDSASGVYEFVRVETASGTGFIPVTDAADATYPYLRVQSQNNGIVAVTDTAGTDIPDNVVPQKEIHSYPTREFTETNWPDAIGDSDIDTISGLTFDTEAFDGVGGVSGDGSDHGLSDTMGDFGQNAMGTWAVAIPFSTTNDGYLFGTRNDGTNTEFASEITDGKVRFTLRGDGALGGDFLRVESGRSVDDGDDYGVIIQKSASGKDAGDLEIYFGPTDEDSIIVENETPGDPGNFDHPMTYFARNNRGDIDSNIEADMATPRWFDDSLTESEREDVFNAWSWSS